MGYMERFSSGRIMRTPISLPVEAATRTHEFVDGRPAVTVPPILSRVRWVAIPTILILISLLGAPPRTSAGCLRGAAACTNMTAMRTCSATVMCTNTAGFPTEPWQIYLTYQMNVTSCHPGFGNDGDPATFTVIARAPTANPSQRHCRWYLYTDTSRLTYSWASISQADDLPVELMDFSIEDDQLPDDEE